ncbi:uncharacterized protein LOC135093455 [Scylla paramamosain]|uniref:uncharacterized protein LOC135093455 n=1 Tax=Scylla paramamosain TaxID=85552 RepID=UPI003082D882
MDMVGRDLDFVFIYLDDILVASRIRQEHHMHLRQLFQRLSEHDLAINLAKCQFGLSSINFLGHRIDQNGAVPLPAKVDAICRFPKPTTEIGLQEFIGMANGMVERFHRHMKTTFKAMASGPDWMGELPWVLLGIHTALKDDLAASSAELADVLHSSLMKIYEGPFRVLQRQLKPFIIDYGGRHETVSVDRLKPAHLDFDRCSWRNPALEGYHYDMRRHALRLRSPDQDVLLWRRPDRLQYSCCGGRGHAAHQTTESSNCGSTNLSLATETPPRSVARALSSL